MFSIDRAERSHQRPACVRLSRPLDTDEPRGTARVSNALQALVRRSVIKCLDSLVTSSMFCSRSRFPVALVIRLRLIFFSSEVAGNNATGPETSDRRRNHFQFARAAGI
jgi:hypothetical protein